MLHAAYDTTGTDADIADCQKALFWGLLDVWNDQRLLQWKRQTPDWQNQTPAPGLFLQEKHWECYGRAIIAPKGSEKAGIPAVAIYSEEGSDYTDVALNDRVALTSFFILDTNVDAQGKVQGAWIVSGNLPDIYPDQAQNADENLRRDITGFLNQSCTYGLYFNGGVISGVRAALPELSGTFKDDLEQKDGYPWVTLRFPFSYLTNHYN